MFPVDHYNEETIKKLYFQESCDEKDFCLKGPYQYFEGKKYRAEKEVFILYNRDFSLPSMKFQTSSILGTFNGKMQTKQNSKFL